MSGHSPPGRDQLARIQMFRALAALMVVFGHAQHHAILAAEKAGMSFRPSHMLPWEAGVDLFFVISGFIIVHASRGLFGQDGATRTFMLRRLIRIVPLYWLCANAYLLISRQFGSADSQIPQDGWGIVASYLFWPVDLFRDGHARPFYDLGWTLNYEMFFYFVFALSLGLRRQKAVLVVGSLMVAVVGLGLLVRECRCHCASGASRSSSNSCSVWQLRKPSTGASAAGPDCHPDRADRPCPAAGRPGWDHRQTRKTSSCRMT